MKKAKALKWYRKAAEQGYSVGQASVGECYLNGYGVKQDYAEAVKWFRKAVEQNDALGQYDLGLCYYNGQGVAVDKEKAKELWRKAKAQGNEDATEALRKYFNE